jgi:Rrf2 family transcriptional regulator, iron-sulfur cluster assembly transcription factor
MNLLSRRSVLAVAAVVDVALHSRSAPVGAKTLAARHKLPPRHLETLLQGLVHAKILKGVRGPRGGYELARERRRITVGEIVRTAMSLSTADPDDLGSNSVLLERVIDPAVRRAGCWRWLRSLRPPARFWAGAREARLSSRPGALPFPSDRQRTPDKRRLRRATVSLRLGPTLPQGR